MRKHFTRLVKGLSFIGLLGLVTTGVTAVLVTVALCPGWPRVVAIVVGLVAFAYLIGREEE